MIELKKLSLILAVASVIVFGVSGCGGGGGDSAPESSATQIGIFVDAPVQGLKYSTPTLSGFTDSKGQFQYKTNETVTFSLGNLELGRAVGQSMITPLTLTGENDLNNISIKATNIARILQSLDYEPSNTGKITIPSALASLENLNIDFQSEVDLNTILQKAQDLTSRSYILKDSESAKTEMKNYIELYSKYEVFQNKRYFGGSTQYYILNMPTNGSIDLTETHANRADAINAQILATNDNAFVQLYDTNMTYIGEMPSQLLAGSYIVKINGMITSRSYVDIYSPSLNPSKTFDALENKRYFGGNTQYYTLNMPTDGSIDLTETYADRTDAINAQILATNDNAFVQLYDTNMTYIGEMPSQLLAGSYIVKISGLTSGSYVDIYSSLLN